MGYNFYGWHMGGGWFPIVFVARGLCDGSCRQGLFLEDVEEVVDFQTQVLSTAVTVTIYNMGDKHDVYGCFQYRGTPKWMVYNGKPIKMDDLGVFPLFLVQHPYVRQSSRESFSGQKTTKGWLSWWLNERFWGAQNLWKWWYRKHFLSTGFGFKNWCSKTSGFSSMVGWLEFKLIFNHVEQSQLYIYI